MASGDFHDIIHRAGFDRLQRHLLVAVVGHRQNGERPGFRRRNQNLGHVPVWQVEIHDRKVRGPGGDGGAKFVQRGDRPDLDLDSTGREARSIASTCTSSSPASSRRKGGVAMEFALSYHKRDIIFSAISYGLNSLFAIRTGIFPLPLGRDSKCSFDRNAAEPQPNPSIRSDLTEGNDGNEEPGQKLRLFVSFVTFCKNSEFLNLLEIAGDKMHAGEQHRILISWLAGSDSASASIRAIRGQKYSSYSVRPVFRRFQNSA